MEAVLAVHDEAYVRFLESSQMLSKDEVIWPYVFPCDRRIPVYEPVTVFTAGYYCFDVGTPIMSDTWQADVVRPLRGVRRLLKDQPWPGALPETVEAVRRRVADAELAAEHAEQIKLANLHMQPADRDRPVETRLRAAVGNLGVYAVCLGVVPDDKDRKAVAALMRETFPALAPPEVAEAVGLAA